jgi:hypothetical protein
VAGFVHSHVVGLVDSFADQPSVDFIAAADAVPETPSASDYRLIRRWNLRRAREVIGITTFYDDWRKLLRREEPDIVICCAENAQHADVTEAAASVGAHVILEKPMAASYEDAVRMAEAVEAAGVRLMVNWPTTWSPPFERPIAWSGREPSDRSFSSSGAVDPKGLARSCPLRNGRWNGGIRSRREAGPSWTTVATELTSAAGYSDSRPRR